MLTLDICIFSEKAFAFVYREVLGNNPALSCMNRKRKAGTSHEGHTFFSFCPNFPCLYITKEWHVSGLFFTIIKHMFFDF